MVRARRSGPAALLSSLSLLCSSSLRVAGLVTLCAAAVGLAGCGTPAVGQACSGSPQLGGCVEGALCVVDGNSPVRGSNGDPVWDSYTCRAACTTQSDCETGYLCQPVPTTPTLSACQPGTAP